MASRRATRRKSRNSGFLHVRSMPHIKMLEKMMKKKDTLVYIYAPWCGACREFDANVMNHVQGLKNKSMNIAKIDSKFASKTSLPAVKYLPTLMLVGKNGVPATFKDENGESTPVMPRANSLSEDREILQNIVQNSAKVNPSSLGSLATRNTVMNRNSRTVKNTLSSSTPGQMTLPSYNKEGSPGRSTVTLKSLAKSPYDEFINGMPTPSKEMEGDQDIAQDTMFTPIKSTIKSSIPVSSPPDIGADLIASQSRKPLSSKSTSGGMLQAIREQTNSLNSLLKLRKTRKH
jgi:thiol-disulfide isomerase/thioredoxin